MNKPTNIDRLMSCPVCNASWDGGDIVESLLSQDWWKGSYTEEAFREHINASYEEPRRWSRLLGVEHLHYDGVSVWQCPDCGARWNRFTQELLTDESSVG